MQRHVERGIVSNYIEQESDKNNTRPPPGWTYSCSNDLMPPLPDKKEADNRDKQSMTIVVTFPLTEQKPQAVGIHVAQESDSHYSDRNHNILGGTTDPLPRPKERNANGELLESCGCRWGITLC